MRKLKFFLKDAKLSVNLYKASSLDITVNCMEAFWSPVKRNKTRRTRNGSFVKEAKTNNRKVILRWVIDLNNDDLRHYFPDWNFPKWVTISHFGLIISVKLVIPLELTKNEEIHKE